MQLQKCRTCGERHRVGPCPSYAKSSLGGGESRPTKIASGNDRNRVTPLAGLVTEGNPIEPRVAGVASSPSEKKKRAPAGSFDRKAYQREYMKKRRVRNKPTGVV